MEKEQIEKLMNDFGIAGEDFRDYCKRFIEFHPDIDPGEICQDVATMQRNLLKNEAHENNGRPHLEILNGGKVRSSGEEFDPSNEPNYQNLDSCGNRTKPKTMNKSEVKKVADKFVESVGITETD